MSDQEFSVILDDLVDKINHAINIPLLSEKQEAVIIRCILQVLLHFLDNFKKLK